MKISLTAAALLLVLRLTAAWASGGDAGDPLISRSYLEGAFSQTLEESVNARLDASDQAILDAVRQELPAEEGAASGGNVTLKEGDSLDAPAGLVFTALGGDVRVSGAVADVTAGRGLASGVLERGHRCIAAEDVRFTVESPAAVVSWQGRGELVLSDSPDYYAIAKVLQSLDLFRGSGSGIGEGFDLYLAPTRGEGLVMFVRLLGEEPEALACTDAHPFTDVPGWLDPYVAWAYRQGYSNGVSAAEFGSGAPISAAEYQELMLRALGYSTAGVDDYTTSLERALDCGALNESEYAVLAGQTFLRAHAAYVSCYSLDMPVSGADGTLAQRMADQGLFTRDALDSALARAESLRLN